MKYILLTLLFLQSFCYQACKAEIPLPLPIAEAQQVENNQKITGTVTRIWDGDTITLEKDNELLANPTSLRIRIAGIDAPETDQPFGKRAALALRHLTLDKTVIAHIYGKDKYNRYLARIYLEEADRFSPPSPSASSPGIDVGLEMLKKGMAWHYIYYDNDPIYAKAEKAAREQYLGLWQTDDPQPPWRYRNAKQI